MISSGDALKSLALEAALSPQEEKLEVGRKKQKLYIGIPRETEFQEQRVALVPESVGLLVANGHRVVIESNAGKTPISVIMNTVKVELRLYTTHKKYTKQISFLKFLHQVKRKLK